MDEAFSDDAAHITASLPKASFAGQLPPINDPIPNDPFNAYDPSLIDLTEFVRLWFSHQTKQVTTGIRTTTQAPSEGSKILTERQQVLQRFSEILRQQEEKGVGTGLERAARWMHVNVSTTASDVTVAGGGTGNGNSANAAAVAKAAATTVRGLMLLITMLDVLLRFQALKQRKATFKKYPDLPDEPGDTRISAVSTLHSANGNLSARFGIILSLGDKLGITVCKGKI